MELALYYPDLGYYARADQRSGRAGDFFTSVDVGPLFGQLLEIQFEEMGRILEGRGPRSEGRETRSAGRGLDLVEAGAGNGRLSTDVLAAARDHHPELYERINLHLVEASAAARAAQRATLGILADRLASSSADLPSSFEGILFANELLDAMPVHQVVMREDGLREVYVTCGAGPVGPGDLHLIERNPSTPALAEYLDRAGAALAVGARAEIGLAAVEWMRDAARRLRRGFIVLVDYGHEARELYSPAHVGGTLTSFARHTMSGSESAAAGWLASPGAQDVTAHVDFSSIRAAAEAEGCESLAFLDQTYFLMGIVAGSSPPIPMADTRTGRALKTLIMPGGLGSTQKVLILGKHVGRPALRGCSFRVRLT